MRAFLQPLPRKLCELWPKAALHPGLREQRYPGEGELHVCSTRVRLSSCLDVRRFNFASSRYSPTGCSSENNPCENDPHIYIIIRIDYVAEASSMLSREVHTHCSICMCCAHPYVPRLQPYDVLYVSSRCFSFFLAMAVNRAGTCHAHNQETFTLSPAIRYLLCTLTSRLLSRLPPPVVHDVVKGVGVGIADILTDERIRFGDRFSGRILFVSKPKLFFIDGSESTIFISVGINACSVKLGDFPWHLLSFFSVASYLNVGVVVVCFAGGYSRYEK